MDYLFYHNMSILIKLDIQEKKTKEHNNTYTYIHT
jgi:hypothetical protein